MKYGIVLVMMSLFTTSCATQFYGSAYTTPATCRATCEGWGMDLQGMVMMGEYSSGCVCKSRSKDGDQADLSFDTTASAVGVALQGRRQSAGQAAGIGAAAVIR